MRAGLPGRAIYNEDDLPEQWAIHTAGNARFFTDVLPGQGVPLGSPGGAAKLGALPADTPLVAGLPPHPMESRNHE